MKIVDLTGKQCDCDGCLGCELVSGKLQSFCGVLFESEHFVVMQDFELPIDGFIVISTKRHIEQFSELFDDERVELVNLINDCLNCLKEIEVAKEYNVILEEKAGYHFHVWLMPRHDWMLQKFGKVIKNIEPIQSFAISNFRTEENFDKIKATCEKLKEKLGG